MGEDVLKDSPNKIYAKDLAAHDWYRFVLSFPPHLVRQYLERFATEGGTRVLDPFCGTGTTLVECKKLGIESVGVEAHPMSHFASKVKVDWDVDPEGLLEHAEGVAREARLELSASGIDDDRVYDEGSLFGAWAGEENLFRTLPSEGFGLLLRGSISPLPLHKTLVLLDHLKRGADERYSGHERLALAKALVSSIGNLRFGPEVGVGPAKPDAPVVFPWLANVGKMAGDLRVLRDARDVPCAVRHADSRRLLDVLGPDSIDAFITSPPTPTRKTTRARPASNRSC